MQKICEICFKRYEDNKEANIFETDLCPTCTTNLKNTEIIENIDSFDLELMQTYPELLKYKTILDVLTYLKQNLNSSIEIQKIDIQDIQETVVILIKLTWNFHMKISLTDKCIVLAITKMTVGNFNADNSFYTEIRKAEINSTVAFQQEDWTKIKDWLNSICKIINEFLV
jgi:hypothetical protein